MTALARASAFLRRHTPAVALSLSVAGAGAIVAYEGMHTAAYKDPVGVVTVCAGHTKTAKLGQVKTNAQCAELLKQDTVEAQATVRSTVKAKVTQEQFDSLVSFVFNVGPTNFRKSSLLRHINAGSCWKAGAEFDKWVYAKGVKLSGLVARRADERKRFETGCLGTPNNQRAQAGSTDGSYATTLVGADKQGTIRLSAITSTDADRRYTNWSAGIPLGGSLLPTSRG